jgi:hypothetical protein
MFDKIKILTFAKGNFIESQNKLKKHLTDVGIKNQKHLTDSDLPENFKQEIFEEYMKWFEPLIDEIKDDKYCGHAQERAVSFFNTVKNKRISLTNGLLKHFQLNSHGTQTIKVNYEVSHNKLIFNQI